MRRFTNCGCHAGSIGAALLIVAGCSATPDMPALPNGSRVDAINMRQRDQAADDERVIYLYEWRGDGISIDLTDYGQCHLRQIARSVAMDRRTVAVEPSGDDAIDMRRRDRVIAALGIADAASLVRVDRPAAYGTSGEEAANVDADTPRGGRSNGTSGSLGATSTLGSGGVGSLRGGGL